LPGRKILDEADAKSCLAAALASGDRVSWARSHGVDARSLNAWRVALDRRAASRTRDTNTAALVELVPMSPPRIGARCVVDVGVGRVEVGDDCSSETLQRVFRALLSC